MRYKLLIAFVAGFITLIVYLPVLQNDFVNWDDNEYVYAQRNVQAIDLRFLKWIFTPDANTTWHPLTFFSLAIDYSVWGLNPFGYHLTNVIIHTINTVIVFILVVRLIEESFSDRVERSNPNQQIKGSTIQFSHGLIPAFTASLLFGIHPLHVESVAWVSERKDVLCAFFFLLTLLAYIRYASMGAKRLKYYSISLILFVLALTSKPMAVSLPVVLLILDFFPLNRFKSPSRKTVIIEKIPFFALSLFSSLITISVQQLGGALRTVEEYPIISRVFVALHSFILYLIKMIFPHNLAPYYPYPDKNMIVSPEYIGTGLLFIIITLLCVWGMRRNRVFAAAWFYYVSTLLPVIGMVKVGGDFAAADRYTYLPAIGPFILAGLGAGAILEYHKWPHKAMIAAALLIASGVMALKTVRQISIWHDSITLWSYEIKLYPDKADIAYINRGHAYRITGESRLAISDFNRVLEVIPDELYALKGRGFAFFALGDYQQAIKDYTRVLELDSDSVTTYNRRGNAYYNLGNYQQAIKDYNMAIVIEEFNVDDIRRENTLFGIDQRVQTTLAESRYNRGTAYSSLKNYEEALKDYDKAIELDPQFSKAYNNRGKAHFALGNYQQAIIDMKRSVEIDPLYARAYYNLSLAYSKLGHADEASANYKKAESLGFKPSP